MKIKILKDIPGCTIDSIYKSTEHIVIGDVIASPEYVYSAKDLIADGYAEEVDEIDIGTIQLDMSWRRNCDDYLVFKKDPTKEELEWFSAYRVVSEVIRQLNGDWVIDWNDDTQFKRCFIYDHCKKYRYFDGYTCSNIQRCILPPCKDNETAQKVIDLCHPELKTLFNIK